MTSKLYSLLLLFVLLGGVVLSHVNFAEAQEEGQEASTEAGLRSEDNETDEEVVISADSILTRPRQTEEIKKLRELYRDQVERYRTVEREFQISKGQYQQLQTLQSLEQAVVSTREVLVVRTDVLITYFELMRTSLEDTEGVDLVDKQRVIDQMIEHILVLREYREVVAQTVDREGIAVRVEEFAIISQPFEGTAYRGLALINIGDIQTVYDKARLIYAEVLAYHEQNPVSAVKQEERNRAYRETQRELDQVGTLLREIRIKYGQTESFSRSNYDRDLGKNLNVAYSGASQILFYLRELFLELT